MHSVAYFSRSPMRWIDYSQLNRESKIMAKAKPNTSAAQKKMQEMANKKTKAAQTAFEKNAKAAGGKHKSY